MLRIAKSPVGRDLFRLTCDVARKPFEHEAGIIAIGARKPQRRTAVHHHEDSAEGRSSFSAFAISRMRLDYWPILDDVGG